MGKFKGRPTIEEPEFSDLVCAIQASWSTGNTNIIFEGDNAALSTTQISNKGFIIICLQSVVGKKCSLVISSNIQNE